MKSVKSTEISMVSPICLRPIHPKMFKTQLTVTLRQRWVKNQLQAANKIALANLVFTNNNNTLTRFNINVGEVGEIN